MRLRREFIPHNRIEVSRSALRRNVEIYRELTGLAIMPVLKGNAYGHGIAEVMRALDGLAFPYVVVDGYFEALRIRSVSRQPVLIMGAIRPENFSQLKYSNFAFVVQDEATIRALGQAGHRVKVHLECNTGMNRYGAQVDQIPALVKLILSYPRLTLEGVMSHLADADGTDPATVESAVQQFDACVDLVVQSGAQPQLFHIAQSAGSLRAHSRFANAIRLGLGLYGLNPFPVDTVEYRRLQDARPALKLISTITHINALEPGDQVSYNYTYTATKPMALGVLPLGYYEAVPRALSGVGQVSVGGRPAPIVGRVCMNHTMIDLALCNAKVGDEVVIYSDDPSDPNSISRVAHEHGLFQYSLLTALSSDVRRVLVN